LAAIWIATLERFAVREMINAIAAAMWAKLAVSPADRPQMVNAGLFVRKGVEEGVEAIELSEHGGASPI
jgi:hypothetical protein